jgi:SAM-dependent methyltransferase
MTQPLEPIRQFWEQHARRDPLWAVLSDGAKRDGQWDSAAFFETGVTEIGSLLRDLDAQGILFDRGAALDFGCGVGRLTQALAPHFARAVGVDISPGMLEVAGRRNRFPERVSYVSNQTADLHVFQDRTFDFLVSLIVLQHLPPDIAVGYLREFFRVLAPAGVLVFQLPSHRRRPVVMPDDAYRASLAVSGIPGPGVGPSEEITLEVAITNRSAIEWSRRVFGLFRVGNHWLDAAGHPVAHDDGRTSLPSSLPPGATCHLPLRITAPSNAGEYRCEIDVAHEGILWFYDKGSSPVSFIIRVDAPPAGAPAHSGPATSGTEAGALGRKPTDGTTIPPGTDADAENLGGFPMNGMSVQRVVNLIADCGGTLLHIDSDRSCGDDWMSYRYVVRNRAEG